MVAQLMLNTPVESHSWSVGDILVSSWGWEQTNIDFYMVTRISAKSFWVVPVGKKYYPIDWASDYVEPDTDLVGTVETRVNVFNRRGEEKDCFPNPYASFAIMQRWKGERHLQTNYG